MYLFPINYNIYLIQDLEKVTLNRQTIGFVNWLQCNINRVKSYGRVNRRKKILTSLSLLLKHFYIKKWSLKKNKSAERMLGIPFLYFYNPIILNEDAWKNVFKSTTFHVNIMKSRFSVHHSDVAVTNILFLQKEWEKVIFCIGTVRYKHWNMWSSVIIILENVQKKCCMSLYTKLYIHTEYWQTIDNIQLQLNCWPINMELIGELL